MALPHAIRVRTADGWQDLALTGPPGPPGADGADGRVYDSDQIGVVKAWTGRTIPVNWALANGQSLTQAAFPQGYDFAKQEKDACVAAGVPSLWDYNAGAQTFTVPNLADKFLLASGARGLGVRSQTNPALANLGEETHTLIPAETAMKVHDHGGVTGGMNRSNPHAHPYPVSRGQQVYGGFLPDITWDPVVGNNTTSNTDIAHEHSITATVAADGTPHNNMPPYVVIAQIVKIKGAQIDSDGDLVGPPGPTGPPGAASTVPGPAGAPGQGVPVGGAISQVLRKHSATDYDTEWANPTGGSGLPEIYIGPDPPTPRDAQVIWVDTDESAPASLNVGMDSWHTVGAAGEPAFTNNWVNYHPTEQSASFRKFPDGRVLLRGLVKSGTVAYGPTGSIFTLPVGYRPAKVHRFIVNAAAAPGEVEIGADGTVQVGFGGNGYVDLAPVEFDTESVQQIASAAAQPLDSVHLVGATGEPAFQNSWVNYASGELSASFRKYPDGRVRLRGLVKNGTVPGTVFTLPAGYRPPGTVRAPTMANGALGYVYIAADGSVVIQSGSNANVGLDFEFDTESLTTYSTGAIIPSAQSMPVTMDVWHTVGAAGEPAFGGSWVPYDTSGTGWQRPGFRKDPTGRVALKGMVMGGTAAQTIFTLPPAYRPPQGLIFPAANGGAAYSEIRISSAGLVQVSGSIGSWLSLDAEFDTETALVTASIAVQPIDSLHLVGNPGEPALQNAWVAVDTPKFRKYPDGVVRVSGMARSGSGPTVFTLPAGYRPGQTQRIATTSNNGGTTVLCELMVNTDGTVQIYGSAATTFASLYIEFDTEAVSNYATAVVQGVTPVIAPTVSVLPASPVDGQECYYRFIPTQTPATTIPLIWHLRWDAATSAWLPVGDQRPVKAIYYTGALTSMGANAWGTYDANDPRLNVPLNGTYECETGYGECYGGGTSMNCGIGKNGTVFAEAGSYIAGSGAGTAQCIADPQVLLTTDAIRQFYWLSASGAQSMIFRGRYIQIRPMRITP